MAVALPQARAWRPPRLTRMLENERLLAANPGNPIVDGIYGLTEPFVAPFRGIFTIDQVSPTGTSVLDVAAVVALVGWALIYLLIIAILSLGDRTRAA